MLVTQGIGRSFFNFKIFASCQINDIGKVFNMEGSFHWKLISYNCMYSMPLNIIKDWIILLLCIMFIHDITYVALTTFNNQNSIDYLFIAQTKTYTLPLCKMCWPYVDWKSCVPTIFLFPKIITEWKISLISNRYGNRWSLLY